MYSIVYHAFYWLKRLEKKCRENNRKPLKLVTTAINYAEWFYNVPVRRWYEKHPSKKYGLNRKPRNQKIIVSFTSYPKRIKDVWLVVETLLRQSVKPDAVILWLAESQFPNKEADLPEKLMALKDRGMTIRFCDDLRSHKKYFYVMQEYPEDLVILADDDLFYPRDTVAKLMKMHQKYPNDICCITAQVIEPEFTAMPSLWRNPNLNEHDLQHSNRIQAFTGSGTLLPPQTLPPEAFDMEQIKALCFHADDLWITFMAHCIETRVTTLASWRPFPVAIYGTADGSLYYINGEGNQNDVQWKNLLEQYGYETIKEQEHDC